MILPINGAKPLRAIKYFDIPTVKNCAQFLKKATAKQKIVRNNTRIRIDDHKNCAHLSTGCPPSYKYTHKSGSIYSHKYLIVTGTSSPLWATRGILRKFLHRGRYTTITYIVYIFSKNGICKI